MNKSHYYIYSRHIFYQNKFIEGYLEINSQHFGGIVFNRPDNEEIVNHEDNYILPEIIDVHNHGYMGWSVAGATSRKEVSEYSRCLASVGVTGVLATTRDETALGIVGDYIHEKVHDGARILGIHAEGPYLHHQKLGAAGSSVLPEPSTEYSEKLWNLSQETIRYTTVAPDVKGIDSSIRFFQSKNIVIAFGHTNATYNEMVEYIKTFTPAVSTHTGNTMRGIDRRDGGTLGAVLLDPHMKCELIADLIHIAPEVIEFFFRVKDISNFLIVSDSGELAGVAPGKYRVRKNCIRIVHDDGRITLENGTLAGSSKEVLYGIQCLVNTCHIPLEKIIPSFSKLPAQLLGMRNKGIVNHGYDADFFVCTQDFKVRETYVEGVKVFDSRSSSVNCNSTLEIK